MVIVMLVMQVNVDGLSEETTLMLGTTDPFCRYSHDAQAIATVSLYGCLILRRQTVHQTYVFSCVVLRLCSNLSTSNTIFESVV